MIGVVLARGEEIGESYKQLLFNCVKNLIHSSEAEKEAQVECKERIIISLNDATTVHEDAGIEENYLHHWSEIHGGGVMTQSRGPWAENHQNGYDLRKCDRDWDECKRNRGDYGIFKLRYGNIYTRYSNNNSTNIHEERSKEVLRSTVIEKRERSADAGKVTIKVRFGKGDNVRDSSNV